MKPRKCDSHRLDSTTILFTLLLIAAGTALLAASSLGVLSLDRLEKFWPLAIVATGMAQLLSWRDERES